ncbi:MAG: V-type ATPase 116kDa subunit family protein [Solirubrobacteraceae bacterium]
MPWSETLVPARMRRVAIVTAPPRLRDALAEVADAGTVELSGALAPAAGEAVEALRRLERAAGRLDGPPRPRLRRRAPAVTELERRGARELLAGEVALRQRAERAIAHGGFALLAGWTPQHELSALRARLSAVGASVVELAAPSGEAPPTLLEPVRVARPFRLLVETYGAVPYGDVDPTPFAALVFFLMFGMMFGDAGDGLLLIAAALLLRRARHPRLAAARRLWPFPAAGGACAVVFGVLYGEFFGPTGILPVLWLKPLDHASTLLVVGATIGVALLLGAHALGVVNRLREHAPRAALLAPSGLAGLLVLLGGVLLVLGLAYVPALTVAGAAVGTLGALLLYAGFRAESPPGAVGVLQRLIELFDALLRTGSNVLSFTRLAAFGLMHAAIGEVVVDGTRALAGGAAGYLAAAVLFVLGSALAFALETLVVGVQALRLEYYELFSRVFVEEGRPFRPWSIPLLADEEAP